MKKLFFAAGLAACLLTGCATRLHIVSEPAGAVVRVRGEGRASFRWETGKTTTPCDMNVYYGRVSSYVIWPDGTRSVTKTVPLSNWERDTTISFCKTDDAAK